MKGYFIHCADSIIENIFSNYLLNGPAWLMTVEIFQKKKRIKKCSSLTESVKRVYVPLMIDVRGKEASLFAPTCLSQSQSFMKFGLFEKGGTEFTRLKGRLNLYYISNSSYFSILFSCFFSYFLSLLTLVKTVKFFVCFSDFCWRFVFLCAMTEK